MTPEQKQLSSLLLREGITGLLQRLGFAIKNMMKLPDKMTTEELADFLGVAKQTVNRWIREQKWQRKICPASKAVARVLFISIRCSSFLMKTPAMRQRHRPRWQSPSHYEADKQTSALLQINGVLQNMTPLSKNGWRCYSRAKEFRVFYPSGHYSDNR
jgi:DNA-binding XRE family transcriptional regulator